MRKFSARERGCEGGCCRGVARVEARAREKAACTVCKRVRASAEQSSARRGWHIKNGGFRRRQTEKKLPDEGVALSLGLPASPVCVCVRVSKSERKEKKI